MKPKTYRNNGAVGALLDEYERAISDLKDVIQNISDENLQLIVDHETKDEDCRSIQTILTHVLRAGYGYATAIRLWKGEIIEFKKGKIYTSNNQYIIELNNMFKFNIQLFTDYPALQLEEHDSSKKIKVTWGQLYDVEQLMEHAIVHILRHRRQIERFKIRIAKNY